MLKLTFKLYFPDAINSDVLGYIQTIYILKIRGIIQGPGLQK